MKALTGRPHCLLRPYNCGMLVTYKFKPSSRRQSIGDGVGVVKGVIVGVGVGVGVQEECDNHPTTQPPNKYKKQSNEYRAFKSRDKDW